MPGSQKNFAAKKASSAEARRAWASDRPPIPSLLMDTSLLWRSALVQLVSVGLLFVILALALPKSFFETWGWLTGPVAWMGCAAITARVLKLDLNDTLLGALLAGLPSVVAVLIGAHEVGGIVSIVLFGLWCGWGPRREREVPTA